MRNYSSVRISLHKVYPFVIILGIWKGPLKRLPLAGWATLFGNLIGV